MALKWWHFGLLVALLMGGVISLFASGSPDGLERVAEDYGFLEKGEGHEVIEAPMPDYAVLGVGNETIAASLAGLIGTLLMFGIAYGIGKTLK